MRIALLEDDVEQAGIIVSWLTNAGHICRHFEASRDFLRVVLRDSYDLLILDWMVPQMSGIEVLDKVRQSGKNFTPVLFITARDEESDVVEALEKGADDYMAKPVRQRELVARVAALGRRSMGGKGADEVPDSAPWSIDMNAKKISLHGNVIELTHREFDLAMFMFRHQGRVVSRGHILESIWGMHGAELNTRTVDTHISRLRKKLGITPETGWNLTAIYQHGYRLERVGDPVEVTAAD